MLIENNLTGTIIHRSINGIGININQNTFLSPAPNPVSLVQIIGQKVEPSLILTRFMNYLRSYYNLLRKGEYAIIHSRYMQSLYRRDGFFWYRDRQGLFKGSIVKVEPSGRLWLKDEVGQERSYLFKEVEYVLLQSE